MNTNTADTEIEDRYDVRLFEPGDRESYLDLYDTVLGTATDEWFAWKYEDNPYTDHVPIVVAEHEGKIVGSKSNMAVRIRWGNTTGLALQPCDTMVHPDHRRRGLYSRMTELAKDVYTDREPLLFFNFPNEKTLAGSLKHGWDRVGRVPVSYRIQRPVAAAGDDGFVGSLADAALSRVLGGYYSLRGPSADIPDGISIERRTSLPSRTLADLYEQSVPDRLHTIRDEQFYNWRFESPKWQYTTYTATDGRFVTAALVVGTRVDDSDETVYLTETLPLAGKGSPEAFSALLQRVVADYHDAPLVAVAGEAIPSRIRRQFGFYLDTAPLLRRIATPNILVSYPLSPEVSRKRTNGQRLSEQSNWVVTFTDMDTR